MPPLFLQDILKVRVMEPQSWRGFEMWSDHIGNQPVSCKAKHLLTT